MSEKIEFQVEDEKPVGTDELASFLGVQRSWVYRNMKKLPHLKVGKFRRFFVSKVIAHLEKSNQ